VPLAPGADWIAAIDAALPIMPAQRRADLAAASGVGVTETAVVITVQRNLDALALAAISAGGDGRRVLTHVEHNLSGEGAESLDPALLAQLVRLELAGQLTATQAKTVLADMVVTGRSPEVIAAELGFEAMDTSELEGIIDGVIAASPKEWEGYCTGDEKRRGKLQGFFVGAVMKATRGQADGKAVTAILDARRDG
jgi:aspartyl-tRNA(Asn)/glutamyl-tRNA(Gln) amidotransferase subunit B